MTGLRDRMRAVGRRGVALTAAFVSVAASVGLAMVTPAVAAPGCRVDYAVPSQWSGGFTANVAVTNTGERVSGWRLTWTWPAGQQVTQAWNATVTSSGGQVTAADASYNAVIEPNGTVSFGFNGSWSGTNTAPQSFALNGVTCTGGGTPPTTTTTTTNHHDRRADAG